MGDVIKFKKSHGVNSLQITPAKRHVSPKIEVNKNSETKKKLPNGIKPINIDFLMQELKNLGNSCDGNSTKC